MKNSDFTFDILVIGAGHAGCEAASAAARMGAATCLVTMDMEKIAQMSCNPAIGGIAKGQIVREVDALGGMTGRITDRTAIQFRMLNRSKGPAMWSPRAQCDRMRFSAEWRRVLENTPNLRIWQDQACELIVENGRATGVRTIWGIELRATCVVITAGTFLNGLMHIGRRMVPGGRIAEPAATGLSESIAQQGIRVDRMKTGTPVRLDARSIHFEELEEQVGENDFHRFSIFSEARTLPQLHCWLCNTNEEVHKVLQTGFDDSPLYNGQIQSIGPRYCPSIETKLHTFPERTQHPLFLEPEGLDTNQLYLNGYSSSLPYDVQIEALRHIPAFRDVVAFRPGYAIEYDFFDPTQLHHTLESKCVGNLYLAGQVNGTTGYEEAAGQGLVAGINAALRLRGEAPFVLGRNEAYIGVLIDDLVTKGVDEPYRMFTSRAEYRILLRQDNVDARLSHYATRFGLLTTEESNLVAERLSAREALVNFCKELSIKPSDVNERLQAAGSSPLEYGCKLFDLVLRPELNLESLRTIVPKLDKHISGIHTHRNEVIEAAEVAMKYHGYIEREEQAAQKALRLENVKIPDDFDYNNAVQLSTEARQKLSRIRPTSLAQASRIPGVSPNDVSILLVMIHR